MISPELNLAEFLNAIEGRDLHDMLRMAESEAMEAEKIAQLKGHGEDYVDALGGFVLVLRCGQRPLGVEEEHFQAFRPVCEKLVARGQMQPYVLGLFEPDR